jgi:hypothetical protein
MVLPCGVLPGLGRMPLRMSNPSTIGLAGFFLTELSQVASFELGIA